MPGSLRGLPSPFYIFACNETVQNMFVRVCSLLAEVCTAFLLCMECVGNVCEAKEATNTRLFRRSSPQLTSHLHKSYCFFPGRSVCVAMRRSGKGKPKILLPFDHSKAWDFSNEEIASLRRSPVTGSKYSVVDRARTYTPTARRRPPGRQCSPGLVSTSSRTTENKLGERLW